MAVGDNQLIVEKGWRHTIQTGQKKQPIDTNTFIQIVHPGSMGEFNELISVYETVFEMKNVERPCEAHLQSLLKSEGFFAVVAKLEGQVIGGLTVYVLRRYFGEKPAAYIYDLAVLPPYQRKGIGKSLVQFSIHYCKQKGVHSVFVQAEGADEDAVAFYRSTRPTREDPVLHFTYQLDDS